MGRTIAVGLAVLAMVPLLGGCGRDTPDAPPPGASSPTATAAPALAAPTPQAESAPAQALRGFWRERDARQWEPAHRYLSRDSRAALPEQQLASQAAAAAPTQGSGAAWAALFTRSVSQNAHALPTIEERDGAKVEVDTPGGPGIVQLVREAGEWKIDLLRTLSSGP